MQSCLGLRFDPRGNRISFDRPTLPSFLDDVVLRGLTIAGGAVDVSLKRSGADVLVQVLRRSGDCEVVTTA